MSRHPVRARIVVAASALLATTLTAGTVATASTAAVRSPSAAAPGHWTQVTTAGLLDFTDIGLARGSDGTLHVLWTTGTSGKFKVMDTPITASGAVGHPVTVAAHMYQATFPDATATPSKIYAFFNTVANSTPQSIMGLGVATRPISGGSWNPLIGVSNDLDDVWGSGVSAATGSDGKPWVVFTIPGGFELLHFGNSKREFHIKGCCVYNPGIGVDSQTGTTWLTYFAINGKDTGTYARELSKSGLAMRVGPAERLPGSDANGVAVALNQRTTATGLRHHEPGVYVTYLSGTAQSVHLGRIGARKAAIITSMRGATGSTLAADPQGQLWVAWYGGSGAGPFFYVRRAAAGATDFGPPRRVPLPPGTTTIWKTYISAQSTRLDIVALLTVHNKIAYWTTQAMPGK
jgi:hypothetical protein